MTYIVPNDLYFTKNHEWASVDENVVTVGLTGFRLNEIGEVLFLDLPEDGKNVRQGESFFTIEGVKVVHDFNSPVTGVILEVNEALHEDPAQLNDDSHNEGWIVKIEMEKETDLANLMRAPEYRKYINAASAEVETAIDTPIDSDAGLDSDMDADDFDADDGEDDDES